MRHLTTHGDADGDPVPPERHEGRPGADANLGFKTGPGTRPSSWRSICPTSSFPCCFSMRTCCRFH